MRRQDVLDELAKHREEIQQRFGIKRLSIFGSIARDEFSEDSDLDVLVEFREDHETFANYMDLKFFLEDLFNRDVDLVMHDAVRPAFRPYIERDAIAIS